MSKPNYRVSLTFDGERKVFQACAPELEHCSAEGATRAEAIGNLETEIDAQLANMLSHGSTPPKSVDEEVFSGELTAKVSKALHKELAFQARSEGMELDALVGELLAAASESRKGTHRGPRSGNRAPAEHGDTNGNRGGSPYGSGDGPPRRQGGFGGRGNQAHLMDDRATFIEYVRGLDQGQGHGSSHGGHARGPNPGGGGGGAGGDRGRRRGRGGSSGGGGGGGRGPGGGGYGGGGGGNGGYRNDSRGNGGQSSHAGPHPGSQGRSDGAQPGQTAAPAPSAPPPQAPSGGSGGGDSDGNS